MHSHLFPRTSHNMFREKEEGQKIWSGIESIGKSDILVGGRYRDGWHVTIFNAILARIGRYKVLCASLYRNPCRNHLSALLRTPRILQYSNDILGEIFLEFQPLHISPRLNPRRRATRAARSMERDIHLVYDVTISKLGID